MDRTPSIEGYELTEKIGSGSFGEVWRAMDLKRKESVAVKFLRLDRREPEYLALFKSEFQILSQLRHVNLARVYDFGYAPAMEAYFFTSEYCLGYDLLKDLDKKSIHFFEAVLFQILSALDYIHSQGIIHMDLKPENILAHELQGEPRVKLVDFGVAARIQDFPSHVGGSLSHMAPELFLSPRRFDHRADLYSLGMVSLLALTGRLPFDPKKKEAVVQWHLKGVIPESIWKGKEIPHYLREVTEKLLAKKASDRFSNARVVLNFLNLATGRRPQIGEESFQPHFPEEGPLVERREEVLDDIEKKRHNVLFFDRLDPVSSVCFLSGERGIGKSRILSEIQQKIELEEIPFLQINCDRETTAWPKLAAWLDLPASGSAAPNAEEQNLSRLNQILEAAKKRPFCLLIDDFQKADRDLQRLILELAERTRRIKGPGEKSPVFVAVATEEPKEDAIALSRLSQKGILEYVRLILGEGDKIESLANLLYQYSGGLPLLMVEGLRFLAPFFYRGEPLENLLPPPEIGLLYQEKIAHLNSEEAELLFILALLFRSVSEIDLQLILGQTAEGLFRLSQNGIRLGLIREGEFHLMSKKRTLQTSNQALSLSVIQSLDPETKKTLHLKIARGLKKIPGSLLQEIAYHLGKGGDLEAAVQHYREASEELKQQGQIAPAADFLLKAIPLVTPGSPIWKKLTLDTARLLIQSGAYREAEGYLERLQANPSAEQEELQAWLHFKQRRFVPAREHYQKALGLLHEAERLSQILIENALGNIDLQEGNPKAAAERFEKTLRWEDPLTGEERSKVNNNQLGLALTLLGDAERALEFYRMRLKRLETFPNEEEERSLLNGMAFVYLKLSRYQEAIVTLKKATALAEKSGAMHALFSMMGNLSSALIKEGRYAESLPLLQKMVLYQKRLGTLRDVAYNLLREGGVYLTLGMIEAAETRFQSGEEMALKIGETGLAPWFTLLKGYVERERENYEQARLLFHQTEAKAKRYQLAELESWATYALADLAYEEGKMQECDRLLGKISTRNLDQEFEARLKLLRAKTSTSLQKIDPDPAFSVVEAECLQEHFREILWEVYYAWGEGRRRLQGPEGARDLFAKGVEVLQSIARPLPEEYRDRYLQQRNRKKLLEEYQESLAPAPKGLVSRVRSLFK